MKFDSMIIFNEKKAQKSKKEAATKLWQMMEARKIKILQQYSIKSLIPLYFQFHSFFIAAVAFFATSSAASFTVIEF